MSTNDLTLLQAQPGGADFSFFLMMGAIFLIFYFLVIRPQQRQQKDREEFLRTAAKGDDIVTSGGIHGKVSSVDGDVLEVEVARVRGEKVKLKVSLGRVDQLTKAGQADADNNSDGSKAKASS
ncbi:MAG: preprotein translocase subunit YajC [bacterium]|nr:preprotein translocase subunit YajC [bacterium]